MARLSDSRAALCRLALCLASAPNGSAARERSSLSPFRFGCFRRIDPIDEDGQALGSGHGLALPPLSGCRPQWLRATCLALVLQRQDGKACPGWAAP